MTPTTYRSAFFSQGIFGPVRTEIELVLTRIKNARARRAVFRTTVAELGNLSNRELADIGIHRSHIHRIAIDAANTEVPHA